jgi:very-short-patch-repair endonuclease
VERRIQRQLTKNARQLRQRMPPAEVALWEHLRGRHAQGYRFRRQMPWYGYIVDSCPSTKVVVEVTATATQKARRPTINATLRSRFMDIGTPVF